MRGKSLAARAFGYASEVRANAKSNLVAAFLAALEDGQQSGMRRAAEICETLGHKGCAKAILADKQK